MIDQVPRITFLTAIPLTTTRYMTLGKLAQKLLGLTDLLFGARQTDESMVELFAE